MSERPSISPLREEIANPQPAGWRERAGLFIVTRPSAAKEKISSWRLPHISPLAGGIGGVILTMVGVGLFAISSQHNVSTQERNSQATSTPDKRTAPTVTPRAEVRVGPEQSRPTATPFIGGPGLYIAIDPSIYTNPTQTTELGFNHVYDRLSLTGMRDSFGYGIGNMVPQLDLGIDYQALNLIGKDPTMEIYRPEIINLFAYITDFDPKRSEIYNDSYAIDHMSAGGIDKARIRVKNLYFQLPRYREMYQGFMEKYNLPAASSDDVIVSTGITYDWVMALRSAVAGSDAVPELTPEQFQRMLAIRPFTVSLS